MSNRKLFYELVAVHVIAWWGIRILSSQTSLLHTAVANSPAWYAVRLARALLTVAIVLTWARWRKVAWPDIGLGGLGFWRNFGIAFGLIAALWVTIVLLRGTPLWAPRPIDYPVRVWAGLTGLVDVLAQQLPTFGLLQGLGARRWPPLGAFGLAWLSFGLAHLIIATPAMVIVALILGLVFGLSLWRTRNLGLGLGVHFGCYFMLALLGWGAA